MDFFADAQVFIESWIQFLATVSGLLAAGGIIIVAIHKFVAPVPGLQDMERKNPDALTKVGIGVIILAGLSAGGFAWLRGLGESLFALLPDTLVVTLLLVPDLPLALPALLTRVPLFFL